MEAPQSVLCDLSLVPVLVRNYNQGNLLLFRTPVLNLLSKPYPCSDQSQRVFFFFRNQEPSFTFTLMHIYGRKSMGLELWIPLRPHCVRNTAKRKVQSAFKTAGSTLTTARSDKRKVRKIYCAVPLLALLVKFGLSSGVLLGVWWASRDSTIESNPSLWLMDGAIVYTRNLSQQGNDRHRLHISQQH